MTNYLKNLIKSKYFFAIFCLILLILKLPTFSDRLMADDFFHRITILGSDELFQYGIANHTSATNLSDSLLNLFSFSSGNPDYNQTLKQYGVIPWWASDNIKLSFFRPLSALTHWIDYQLWPDLIPAMYLHSFLWFVLALYLLFKLYQKLSTSKAEQALALFIFAMSLTGVTAMLWLANRNMLIGICFSLLSLLYFIKFNQKPLNAYHAASLLFACLALLSAESAISLFAFIAMYELFMVKSSMLDKLKKGLPYLLILVGWRLAYSYMGYGESGTGFYIDPINDSTAFFLQVISKTPLIIFQHVFGIGGIDFFVSPSIALYLSVFGAFFLLAFYFMLRSFIPDKKVFNFLTASLLLITLPLCMLKTTEIRQMMYMAIPSSLILAKLIIAFFNRRSDRPFLSSILVSTMIFIHIFLATSAQLALTAAHLIQSGGIEDPFKITFSNLSREDMADMSGKQLVIINMPDTVKLATFPYALDYYGIAAPRTIKVLMPGYSSFTVEARDHHTLIIKPEDNAQLFNPHVLEKFAFHNNIPFLLARLFQANNTLQTDHYKDSHMKIRVNQSRKSTIDSIHFRFSKNLNDKQYHWLKWNNQKNAFESVAPPTPEQSIRIQGVYE